MKRGDVVLVVPPGSYGKPRPAIIVQSDLLNQTSLGSVIVCLISSHIEELIFRITLEPTPTNGLKKPSQIMTDKMLTIPRERIGEKIGVIDTKSLNELTQAMALCLGMVKLH